MLQTNQIAPDFQLQKFGGGSSSFYTDSSGKLAVLVFYKFSCPVCQFALPFLQKIYEAYGNSFYFVAIAQDPSEKIDDFRKQYGITIPTLMDLAPYKVSSEYHLEIVPSIFLINPDHTIRYSGEGFAKQDLLNLADVLAERTGRPQIEVFGNANVPDYKPG